MKYDLNFKLDCVGKYKKEDEILSHQEFPGAVFLNHACSQVKTFDELGIDGLKHNSFNKQQTVEQRFDLPYFEKLLSCKLYNINFPKMRVY